MANIEDVEQMLGGMLRDQHAEDQRVLARHMKEKDWVEAEIAHWKTKCEELEIELECVRNAFPEHDDDILPKHRGIF